MKRRTKIYEPGDVFTVYLIKDIPEETLEWINSQREIGPAILELIRKLVNGKLIDVDNIEQYLNVAKLLSSNNMDAFVRNTDKKVIPLEHIKTNASPVAQTSPNQGRVVIDKEKEDKEVVIEELKEDKYEEVIIEEVNRELIDEKINESASPDSWVIEDENPFEEEKEIVKNKERANKGKLNFSFDIKK